MFSTSLIDYAFALLSCVLGVGYFLRQLREEKPPPGFLSVLRAIVFLSLLVFAAVLYQHRG